MTMARASLESREAIVETLISRLLEIKASVSAGTPLRASGYSNEF